MATIEEKTPVDRMLQAPKPIHPEKKRRPHTPATGRRRKVAGDGPVGGLHADLAFRLDEARAALAKLQELGAERSELGGQWEPAASAGPGKAGPDLERLDPSAGDACRLCGGGLRRAPRESALVCAECGLVEAGDPTQPDGAPSQPLRDPARVRIVGPGSAPLQPDLHRSGQGPSPEAQQRQIVEEYSAYVKMHVEAGGRSFPETALRTAAGHYNAVQRLYVKRSQNKKAIMAACLWVACIDIGFAPTKVEVAQLMQLQNRGIARGTNFLRNLVADNKMDINVNVDPCRPEIVSLFARLGLDAPAFAGLREATYEIVQLAISNHIGTSSVLRSKVAGAAFAVLRRSSRALLPRPPSQAEFCQNWIRKNTLERFLRDLGAYHSFFAGAYAKAGLADGPTLP